MSGGRDRSLPWLLGALALVVSPHALRQPPWVSAIFVLFWCWRTLAWRSGWPLPGRHHPALMLAKNLFAVGMFVAVVVNFGGRLGRDAGIALLVILTGLKLLELQRDRDTYIVTFLGYFLVVTNFLYTQTIPMALLMFAVVVVLTTGLLTLNDRGAGMSATERLRLVLRMLAQTVPVLLLLFFLFPRLPGPLWGLPQTGADAVSGLSDELSLGNISELSLSDELAFRVDFGGEPPPPRELYWRGPVLWNDDGRSWTVGSAISQPPPRVAGSSLREYTVTLEAHEKRWLFGLDLVAAAPPGSRLTADFRLLSDKRVRRRIRYSLGSITDYRVLDISAEERSRALQLPPGAHPRARALAARWAAEGLDARALAERALAMFREQAFFYTLRPPMPVGDPVDEFLFQARRGFCEHFAAAFTVLMRAAGVPARLVTGYQGGQYNPVGGFVDVRQRDAHAWAEIWIAGEGWVRADPTAVVAPQRIDRGIDTALPRSSGVLSLAFRDNPFAEAMLRRLRNLWGAAGNAWNQWVLGYSTDRQQRLLERLGLERVDWLRLGFILTVLVTIVFTALAIFLARSAAIPRRDPARRAWDRFCARMARLGVERNNHEGPVDFGARAAKVRADLATAILQITDLYVRARYAQDAQAAAELARQVRAFPNGGRRGGAESKDRTWKK